MRWASKVVIIPFEIEHFDRMDLQEGSWQRREDRGIFACYPKTGPAFTLMAGQIPICSGGIVTLWDGVGEAWMLVSKHVQRYPLSVYRSVLNGMNDIIKKQGLHRVQAVVKGDDRTSVRWIKKLGFTREGTLRQFGPDKTDYVIYGRIG